jgi:hypothetical protein
VSAHPVSQSWGDGPGVLGGRTAAQMESFPRPCDLRRSAAKEVSVRLRTVEGLVGLEVRLVVAFGVDCQLDELDLLAETDRAV